jgi:hypothetical protein
MAPLRNTGYFVTSAVWNEDEIGAERYRDALVRWPKVFEFELPDKFHSQNAFLLFPDLLTGDWKAATARLHAIEGDGLLNFDINPFAVVAALVERSHDDAHTYYIRHPSALVHRAETI